MTRCVPACIVAFGLAAVGVSAQYPEQKPADKQMPSKSAQSVTIAGCVREGDTPNTFVLSNVDAAALAAHGSGATGTSGAPAAGAATATVQLITTADIDLKKHVGHKVEVSGSPIKPEAGAAGTAGTPSSDTTAREADKDKNKPALKLTVKSVKHLAESCSM
jgi:hypothetical protein